MSPRLSRAIVLLPVAAGLLGAQTASNDAIYRSAREFFNQGRFEEAEDAFRKLAAAEPEGDRAIAGIAEIYVKESRTDEAIDLLRSEANARPKQQRLRVILGDLYVQLHSYDLAIAEYQRAIDADSKMAAEIYLKMGEAYHKSGDFESALRAYETASKSGSDERAPLQAALILEGSGQRDKAIPFYRQALSLSPDQPVALNNLAYLIAESGRDLDQALAMAERAHAKDPDSPDITDTLGWIYLKAGKPDQAIKSFREAAAAAPNLATVHYHLGLALAEKGERQEAVSELNTALRNGPSNEERRQIEDLLIKLR